MKALTPDEIANAIRIVLDREPRDAAEIARLERECPSVSALSRSLLDSFEFQVRMAALTRDTRRREGEFAAPRTVFMHIPKTAGTTLRSILRDNFEESQVFPDGNWIGAYPANIVSKYQLFSGHFTLNEIQHIPGEKRIFTLLRDPRQRVISYYKYLRAKGRAETAGPGDRVAPKLHLPLKEFLADPDIRRSRQLMNMQTRYLHCVTHTIAQKFGIRPNDPRASRFAANPARSLEIAKENLSQLSGFGLVERFDDFIAAFLPTIGLKPVKAQAKNVTNQLAPGSENQPTQSVSTEIDAETHGLLDDLVSLDEPLYQFARDLFAARYDQPREYSLHRAAR